MNLSRELEEQIMQTPGVKVCEAKTYAVAPLPFEFIALIRVVSEANQREHYLTKHRRKKKQQYQMGLMLAGLAPPAPPLTITLTKLGSRKLDADNLAGAFKHVQDTIARWLGVDDGDGRLTWRYEQAPKGSEPHMIRVLIEEDFRS